MYDEGLDVAYIPKVDYKDAFFQDLRAAVEPLVRNSLFSYLAYVGKAEEVAKYREDPKADVPYLKREAALRGTKLADLVQLVEEKGESFKASVNELELLRVEFNLRYSKTTNEEERLHLRDEFLGRLNGMTLPTA